MLLKEKVKLLEEEKNKLEEEFKCSNVYAGSLKNRLFSYDDSFITDEKLFRATTGLEVEKFKILYEYLDPGENCKNIKYHDLAKDKEKYRSVVLSSSSFLLPASKPGPRPKLAGVDPLFLFLPWLRLGSPLKHIAWLFNLSKHTASRYIFTWANFI